MTRSGLVLGVLLASALLARTAEAQEATRQRLDVVLTAAPETPGGQGLLPTAIAEARAVVDQALLMERADDLRTIHQAAEAILAALDPRLSAAPAAWYEIRRATAEIAAEVAAIQGDRAADAQQTGPRVADAARNVLAWCEALAEVAQRVRGTRDRAEARALTTTLRRLAQQILQGRDADGDGRVTFAPGEAGLQLLQVSVRMRAGGSGPPPAGTSVPHGEAGR